MKYCSMYQSMPKQFWNKWHTTFVSGENANKWQILCFIFSINDYNVSLYPSTTANSGIYADTNSVNWSTSNEELPSPKLERISARYSRTTSSIHLYPMEISSCLYIEGLLYVWIRYLLQYKLLQFSLNIPTIHIFPPRPYGKHGSMEITSRFT